MKETVTYLQTKSISVRKWQSSLTTTKKHNKKPIIIWNCYLVTKYRLEIYYKRTFNNSRILAWNIQYIYIINMTKRDYLAVINF